MTDYIHNSSEALQRTKPKIWDPRYFYLLQLKKLVLKGFGILNINKELKLLDFGCGASPYKQALGIYPFQYYRADLIENPSIDYQVLPSGQIKNEDDFFDLVLSTQVLEHVPDYAFYLSEAKRVLNPKGKLILTTHGHWMYHPDPTDYWRWTSMGLKKIIEDAGFELLHFEGIIGRSAIGLQLFQDGLMFKLPKPIRVVFIVIMQFLVRFFDKVHSKQQKNDDACTYLVVAQKR